MKKNVINSLLLYWQYLIYPPKNSGVEAIKLNIINPASLLKKASNFL